MRLPEIVAAILEHLQHHKDILAAVQVNRLWAAEATTRLWRIYPQIQDLARIEDIERLQCYANKISVLGIRLVDDECEGHQKLRDVHFARLKYLSISIYDCKKEQMFLQYLQPHLRTLVISGGPMSDSFLVQIRTLCPALQDLSLCHLSGTITATDLLEFLSGMPSLIIIYLWGGLENVISDEVYFHLASRPNLTKLSIGDDKTLTLSFIKALQEAVHQPFPRLDDLLCFSESNTFSQFSRHLNGLTKLHMHLVDAGSKLIFDLCLCTNLVTIQLNLHDSHFKPNAHFPPEGLLAIAKSCSHLQSFVATVNRVPPADGSITNITDEVIRQFVALLPGLSSFKVGFKTNLTERALRFLGEGCAGLNFCSLDGKSFDLPRLGSGGPTLFPQLEWLELRPVEDCISATMVAETLDHHAPRIRTLGLRGSTSFIREVRKKMRELNRSLYYDILY